MQKGKYKNVVIIGIDSLRYDSFLNGMRKNYFNSDEYKVGKMYVQSGPTAPSQSTIISGEETIEGQGYNYGVKFRRQTIFELLQKIGYNTIGISCCAWLGRHFGYDRGMNTFIENYPRKSLNENIEILKKDFLTFQKFDEIEKLNKAVTSTASLRETDLETNRYHNNVMHQDNGYENHGYCRKKYLQNFKRIFPSIDETLQILLSKKSTFTSQNVIWFTVQEIHELYFFDPPSNSPISKIRYFIYILYWRILYRNFIKIAYRKSVTYTMKKIERLIDQHFGDYLVIIYSDHGFNLNDFSDKLNAFSSDLKYLTVPLVVRAPYKVSEVKSNFEIKSQDFLIFAKELIESGKIAPRHFDKIGGFFCCHGTPGALLPNEKPIFKKYIDLSKS